jgi:hypothetical protein
VLVIPDISHLPNAEELPARLGKTNIGQLKRKRIQDEDDEMALFRRVRVRTSSTLPSLESRPGPQASDIYDPPGSEPVVAKDRDAYASASQRPETGRGSRWESVIKDLTEPEEEYFNTTDDLSKPLVDYASDEDVGWFERTRLKSSDL